MGLMFTKRGQQGVSSSINRGKCWYLFLWEASECTVPAWVWWRVGAVNQTLPLDHKPSCLSFPLTSSFPFSVIHSFIHSRQELDGSQAEQLESVPCGQILQDKDYGRSKEELRPAWIKDKETTYFSFLRSRRPSKLYINRKVLEGSENGGGARS